MEQKSKTKNLKRELDRLEKEFKKSEKENENQKKKLADEIRKLNKNEMFNPKKTEINYTLWQRIMRVLGVN
jgi:hypothetical protein